MSGTAERNLVLALLRNAGELAVDASAGPPPVAGKAGICVRLVGGNLLFDYVNEAGASINFPTAKADKLVAILTKQFPQLANDVFFGYCETVRRRQGLASRLKTFVTTQGRVMFESIDPDTTRQAITSFDPAAIAKMPTGQIPRRYTMVDLGPPATRTIFITELRVGSVRPDEVVIRYQISQEELDLVKKGTPFKDIPTTARKARNMTMHAGDPNRQISAAAFVEHFEKTTKAITEVIGMLAGKGPGNLGITIEGTIDCTTTDTLVGPGSFKASADVDHLTYQRATEQGTTARSAARFRVLDGGKVEQLLDETQTFKATGNVDEKAMRAVVTRFIAEAGDLLAKAARFVPAGK